MGAPTRTIVTFETTKFNTSENHAYFLNPNNFGDDLCRWMVENLHENVDRDTKVDQEDFGWYFNFQVAGEEYCFVCGYRQAEGTDSGTWIGWVERSVSFLASIFGGRNRNIGVAAVRAIHQVLAASPDIENIRWHFNSDFSRGNEESGVVQPD